MSTLVTGGTGWVGAEIVRQLVNRGEEVIALVHIAENRNRLEDVEQKVKFVRGDLADFSEVLDIVKNNKVDTIYHTASTLNAASWANPATAFRSNVLGTHHVYEAARLFGVSKLLFTSSRGAYGRGLDKVIDDWTLQRPATNYGWAKVYNEGMGRFYKDRFGLDFRSVRYATIIVPGDHVHESCVMIENAILHRPFNNPFGPQSVSGPFTYISDAAKSAIDLLNAPKDKIKTVNYNVTGTTVTGTAQEFETYLMQRYPGFEVTYNYPGGKPAKAPQMFSYVWDDSYARKEWGWKPVFDTYEAIVEQFEKDVREHSKRYNITL
jgi:nucleoside-diphosphate-sugar epimerase